MSMTNGVWTMNSKLLQAGALIAGLALWAGPSVATPLNGEEIKDAISGKRVFLKVPFGGEFPLRYDPSGVVRGDGTAFGVGRFFSPKDEGKWWVRNGKLCQQWQEWYDGKTACFIISNYDGTKFKWLRDDGRKGKGRIE
ncbi:MAG: hypothetical protein AAFW47_05385 [Pseudomonadota bacterium]